MQNVSNSDKKILPVILPWVVAAVALVLYLATLNHWVSLLNIVNVGRTTGSMWQPNYLDPLFAVVTYPFRLLPDKLVPLCLNVFAAVCAGLTLALLARSVMLLPADRTEAQRQRVQSGLPVSWVPLGWLPPVLAAVICGLQLSFWEHATNASGQMFKLLLFAYIIRCLLEFRQDKKQSWLSRAAILYGAGIANNWAMIGFFPLFIVALIWIKGFNFFNLGFLFRMAVLGLVGLSVYFFIPLAQSFSHITPIPFGTGLHNVLGGQKQALFSFPRQIFLLLSLTSLLPLLIISIRWSPNLGDTSPLGQMLARLVFHVVHGAFFVACLWVMFDPGFAPRPVDLAFRQGGAEVPFLTFYYLGALSIGYFSMYFLQVFGIRTRRDAVIRPASWQQPVNLGVRGGVVLLAALAIAGLPYKNIPEIHHTNGSEMIQFGSLLTESLPTNALVLSTDLLTLQIAEATLARSGSANGRLFVEARSLAFPSYHNYLHARYGTNWSETIDTKRVTLYEGLELAQSMVVLAQNRPVYYLNPSIGYYFEYFYGIPHGLALEMKAYPRGVIFPPHLSEAEIAENRTFWKKAEEQALPPVLERIQISDTEAKPSFRKFFMDKLHLKPESSIASSILGRFYSRSLNLWGVQIQIAGQLKDASHYFGIALELNPGNVIASINQEFNRNLLSGTNNPVTLDKTTEEKFRQYAKWDQVIDANGPVDEPVICLDQSKLFLSAGFVRQAASQLQRVTELEPDNFLAHIELAGIYIRASLPDQALATISKTEARPENFARNSTNRVALFSIKTSALYLKKDVDEADRNIQTELRNNPANTNLLNSILQICLTYSRYTNGVAAANALLRLVPNDAQTLDIKGYLHLQLNQLDQAIETFSRALTVDTNNNLALLNRAITYLRADKLDESQRDYQELKKIFPKQFQIDYGLGEIAWRRKDTKAAIESYESYIANAGTNSAEAQMILGRLKELKDPKP